jgi:hypothetical protein
MWAGVIVTASVFAGICKSTEYTHSEETAPSSAEEIRAPLDAALEKRDESREIILHDLKRRLENQPPWLRDAHLCRWTTHHSVQIQEIHLPTIFSDRSEQSDAPEYLNGTNYST